MKGIAFPPRVQNAVALSAVVGLFAVLPGAMRFAGALRASLDQPAAGVDTRNRGDFEAGDPLRVAHEGGAWKEGRWSLPEGTEGRLTVRYAPPLQVPLRMALWVQDVGDVRVEWRAAGREGAVPRSAWHGGVTVLPAADEVALTIRARQDLPGEQRVLQRLVMSCPARPLPSPAPFAAAVVFLAVALFPLSRRWGWGAYGTAALIVLAAVLGARPRWDLFALTFPLKTEADVNGYINCARDLRWFTVDQGFMSGAFLGREPLFIGLLNLWFKFWGGAPAAARLFTLSMSSLLIVAAGLFVWDWSRKGWQGVIAAMVMALHGEWIDLSVRGMREEVMTILTLAALWTWRRARGWKGAVLLGVVTGLAGLLRSTSLTTLVPLYWLGWGIQRLRRGTSGAPVVPPRWPWPALLIATAVAAAMYAPHALGLRRVHGYASWPYDQYARWNANMEFPERLGTPGFPTVEEMSRTAYAGPRLTYDEYFWGMHSPGTLLRGQLKGWAASTLFMAASWRYSFRDMMWRFLGGGWRALARRPPLLDVFAAVAALSLCAIGWGASLRRPDGWWAAVFAFWGTWPVAYLYSVRLVEVFRHTAYVHPLWVGLMIEGAAVLAMAARRRTARP